MILIDLSANQCLAHTPQISGCCCFAEHLSQDTKKFPFGEISIFLNLLKENNE